MISSVLSARGKLHDGVLLFSTLALETSLFVTMSNERGLMIGSRILVLETQLFRCAEQCRIDRRVYHTQCTRCSEDTVNDALYMCQ